MELTPEIVMWLAVSRLLLTASLVIAVAVRAIVRELRQK
jgi:hypothetical protein